jgi:hypothetical protein
MPRGMTVLIESRSDAGLSTLTAELAWCLERFVTGRADESTMRRAEHALKAWEAYGVTIDLRSD